MMKFPSRKNLVDHEKLK